MQLSLSKKGNYYFEHCQMLSYAFENVQNREMKSESGFSLAMASQPIENLKCPLIQYN